MIEATSQSQGRPAAVPQAIKRRSLGSLALGLHSWLIYVFLYAPIVILVLFSFTTDSFGARMTGFTFQWYGRLLQDERLIGAAWNTLKVALASTIVSTIIGTLTALAMERYRFRGRTATDAQRAQYVELFRANVLAALSRRMNFYTGSERLVVTGSQPAGEDTMVSSEINYGTKDAPLKIGWRVRTSGSKPSIIDVLPEGVSLVLTYRSEFDEVVGKGGMDGLIAELKARAAARAKA